MVKYVTFIIIVALALLAVLTLRFSKDSYKILPLDESDPATVDLEQYNFQDWKEFEAPDGKFKVMIPTIPQNAADTVTDSKTGKDRKYEMYVSERLDGTIFMISLITFEEITSHAEEERLLGSLMDDMVNSSPKNEITYKAFGEFRGSPALEFALRNPDLMIHTKTFFINKTMYVLTRVSRDNQQDSTEFNFFVNSFELTSP